LWSGARVGGMPLSRWPGWDATREAAIAVEVREAAQEIIRKKGATNHAIGLVTASLLRWAMRGERRILTVSRIQDDIPGLEGVALSLPTIVGSEGARQVLQPEMNEAERAGLMRSAEILRKASASVAST
jgi:L-lactate dehydrogenase